MNTKRVLIGTLVAAVAMFLLGWVMYGMLLKGFMDANCDTSLMRPENEMIMWAIALSNVLSGLMLALVLEWSGRTRAGAGAMVGAVLGFLIGLSFDLSMYSMSTIFLSRMVIVVDSLMSCVMFAVCGMLAGWAMGKWGGSKAAS